MKRLDLDKMFLEALGHHQSGRLAEAEKLYRKLLKIQPKHFDSLHLLGVVQAQYGRHADALRHLDAAVKINPRVAPVLNNRGNILNDLGRLDDAVASYDEAIAIKPDYAEAHANRAHALLALRRYEDALGSYDRAITLRPDDVEAHIGRGSCLMDLRRMSEGLASFDRAIALMPGHPQAHCIRAGALLLLGQHGEAIASCDRAISLAPGYAEAYFMRGNALLELKRYDQALMSFDRAIAIKPDYAEAHNNRGNALRPAGRLEEALASYDRALAINPHYAGALNNRGLVLKDVRRVDDALTSFDRAIAIVPDYADAYANRGFAKLLIGRFLEGWRDNEWRWRQPDFPSKRPDISAPDWQGEDLAGRRVIVFAEQGLGDTIQFARYLPSLVARGAKVTFLVTPKLSDALRAVTQGIDVVDQVPAGQAYDFQSALLSLPQRFGTDLSSIPACVPYLRAEPEVVGLWKQRICPHRAAGSNAPGTLRVGVSWAGNPAFKWDQPRSIGLPRLLPLLSCPGAQFFSLQKDLRAGDVELLGANPHVIHLGNAIDSFSDTAAIMSLMDVVISSDTSVVHLAGALGAPTWTLLQFVPDWRWLLDRQDSPWYPTMRLFRQSKPGDWDGVVAAAEEALAALIELRQAARSLE